MPSVESLVRPVPGVPRRVTWLAAVVALAPLPSFLYRLPMAAGHPMGFSREFMDNLHAPGWGSLYVVTLGLVSEMLALACLGLVRPWGQRWPRWAGDRAGRALPVALAAVPATGGALLLTAFGSAYVYTSATADGDGPTGALEVLMHLCYAPLVVWGPALFLLVAHYVRRRRRVGALHPPADARGPEGGPAPAGHRAAAPLPHR